MCASLFKTLLVCAVLLLVTSVGFSEHGTAQDLESLKHGVVMIRGATNQIGTGIVVGLEEGKAYIATASHVIEGGKPPTVSFYAAPLQTFEAKVLGLEGGNTKGLAALVVEGQLPKESRTLMFNTQTFLKGGEDVDLIGFPHAAGRVLRWGVTAGKITARSGPDPVLSGAVNSGNSGGPILYQGQVVGIVTEKVDDFALAKPASIAKLELDGWQMVFTDERQPIIADQDRQFMPPDDMVLIPAGTFTMGSVSGIGEPNEHPEHEVFLNAFYIDQFEVTTERYETFLQATNHENPKFWNHMDRSRDTKKPVVGVSWYDAKDYCSWDGKRLPTEAEWEKAARGTDKRIYPWGDSTPNSRLANFSHRGFYVASDLYKQHLRAVGSYEHGKSPYRVYDMAGNVWEWVSDWYDKDYYQASPKNNPAGPSNGAFKVLRGGSWTTSDLRSARRSNTDPSLRADLNGFRCAQDVR